jgi:hypothetical protein
LVRFLGEFASWMHAPYGLACIKSMEIERPPKASDGRNSLETRVRKLFPHIERLSAQGTVASPARLPDSVSAESLLMLSWNIPNFMSGARISFPSVTAIAVNPLLPQ